MSSKAVRPGRGRVPWALLACTAALAAGAGAAAEPAPPFPELLRQALAGAPAVVESAAGVREAEGLARQAAARPNPTAGLEVENFGARGLDLTETTLSASQTLEIGGKRRARIAVGQAEVETAEARLGLARSQLAYDLALAYAEAEAAARRASLAREGLDQAREDARIAEALVEAGREAEVRALQARSAVAAAKAGLDAAEAERDAALAKLTALAGAAQPYTGVGAGLLAYADRPAPVAEADPRQSPAYLAALQARRAAERRVDVEKRQAVPDPTLSFGVRRLGESRGTALVAGVSIPIPVFDRNQGAVAAARAALRGAEARLDAARLDAEAEIRTAAARIDAAGSRLAAATEAERTAQEAYRLARLGYEGGKLPLIELIGARRALTEARARTLDARLGRIGAEAALARVQGRLPFGDL